MIIDPELKPRRDAYGRKLPEEPIPWVVVLFTVIFVGGFWLAIWLAAQAVNMAQLTLHQRAWNIPFYQLAILGMLFATAGIIFYHFRDVRKSRNLVLGQVIIGVTGGVFVVASDNGIDAKMVGAAAALVTIANGIKTLREIGDARRMSCDE